MQNEIIEASATLVRIMMLKEMEPPTDCYSLIADETRDHSGVERRTAERVHKIRDERRS